MLLMVDFYLTKPLFSLYFSYIIVYMIKL